MTLSGVSWFDRIVADPAILGGKPIKEKRFTGGVGENTLT
jgi:uncharacterized protein (DUF433 family)